MKQILVVDDDILRQTVKFLLMLEMPDVQVLQAPNGEEAITLALARHPDLILLDGNMPVMDGGKTARALRQMPETRSIPLIAISAEGGDSPILRQLHALCDTSIPKPFSCEDLMSVIRAIEQQTMPVAPFA
jgi:CheY-like chemotaxis protein